MKEPTCLLLFHPLHLNNIVEELPSAGIFHDKIQLFLSLDNLIELNDLWMPHDLEDVNLAGHSLNVSDVADLALLKDFNCYLLLGEGVRAQLHLTESALAYGLAQDVVPDCLVSLRLLLLRLSCCCGLIDDGR